MLEKGRLYRVRARNFSLAVFDGRGMIGIREKFGSRFLAVESMWDDGPPFGTVPMDVEPLDAMVPEDIPLSTSLGVVDVRSGRPVKFDRPVVSGGRGWYFEDSGESALEISPVSVENRALFEWLDAQEAP